MPRTFLSGVILMTGINQPTERHDRALERFATIGDMRPGALPANSTGAASRAAAALTTTSPGTVPAT